MPEMGMNERAHQDFPRALTALRAVTKLSMGNNLRKERHTVFIGTKKCRLKELASVIRRTLW